MVQAEPVLFLIAFDCDNTLDIGGGPIRSSRLQELDIQPCCKIVIVSPSPKCTALPFPKITWGNTRENNLRIAAETFPAVMRIYISDNPGDDQRAKAAGYAFIHPKNFS